MTRNRANNGNTIVPAIAGNSYISSSYGIINCRGTGIMSNHKALGEGQERESNRRSIFKFTYSRHHAVGFDTSRVLHLGEYGIR
jgi:hypothetical protein